MYSSNEKRGYQPPQNEQEKQFVRRIEELCALSQKRGICRYTDFLSSREQMLAQVALNRCDCQEYSFDGGYSDAERRILRIEPADAYSDPPICCIQIECLGVQGGVQLSHRDYLGAILGLGLNRQCVGDILLSDENPKIAYVFVLQHVQQLICDELVSIGRQSVRTCPFYDDVPYEEPDRVLQTATVSSLRVDAVIAAMIKCSRTQAVELLRSGRIEINHVSALNAHAAVYEGDLFTVRGKGRYRLQALGGKSRKERFFIQFFQY